MKNDCLIVIVEYAQSSRIGIVNDYHLKLKKCNLEGRDHKNSYFGVQGHLRPLNSVAIKSQFTTLY